MRNGSNSSAPLVEKYVYDAEGIRMLTIQYENETETQRIYTPTKEMMRIVNSSGTFDYRYVYAGDKLVARLNPDNSKWYYHGDHLGSTSLVTTELLGSPSFVEETFYEPYGEVTEGGTTERKLYTGHEQDQTGQTYMKARYYVTDRGQFIQPDKIISNVFDPQDLNHYSYVRNNPYKYTDPTGHIGWIPLFLILVFYIASEADQLLDVFEPLVEPAVDKMIDKQGTDLDVNVESKATAEKGRCTLPYNCKQREINPLPDSTKQLTSSLFAKTGNSLPSQADSTSTANLQQSSGTPTAFNFYTSYGTMFTIVTTSIYFRQTEQNTFEYSWTSGSSEGTLGRNSGTSGGGGSNPALHNPNNPIKPPRAPRPRRSVT